MASIGQVRGALLEEIVLFLLGKTGYRTIEAGEEGTRQGTAGLEVEGRGEWHQIDALAEVGLTPPFMYPLRLIIEAKCQSERVDLPVVRNTVGVLKDIVENHFSNHRIAASWKNDVLHIQPYNYHAAIFSASGYAETAQNYAFAHQIFLIQYKRIPLIRSLVDTLLLLRPQHFRGASISRKKPRVQFDANALSRVRYAFRKFLRHESTTDVFSEFLDEEGVTVIMPLFLESLHKVGGSYYGIIRGKYPVHLLSENELPASLFQNTDSLPCHLRFKSASRCWFFCPAMHKGEDESYFELQFDMPEQIAELLDLVWDDPARRADTKETFVSHVDLTGKIAGITRHVRLELEREWLEQFKKKFRKKK